MKKQLSTLLGAALLLGTFSTAANADVKRGQKAYLKKCKRCHGNGTKGAAMKTQKEWEDAFANDAAQFRAWHKDDKKAMKYIDSSRFKKDAPNLKDFLYEYGSDSGNVPSCG
ncbi:c-type cytochrome [Thiomicrolovo sp. ZZH C-3]